MLQKATEQVVDYIWRNVHCMHIRIELYHQLDEPTGKLQADPDVKNALTKVGFKWKTLSNDPVTGKRAQIMQLNKPAAAPALEKGRAGEEPVTIKAGLVMTIGQVKSTAASQDKKSTVALVSCILGSLNHLKDYNEGKHEPHSTDAQLSQLIRIGTSALPKDTTFAAQRTMISEN